MLVHVLARRRAWWTGAVANVPLHGRSSRPRCCRDGSSLLARIPAGRAILAGFESPPPRGYWEHSRGFGAFRHSAMALRGYWRWRQMGAQVRLCRWPHGLQPDDACVPHSERPRSVAHLSRVLSDHCIVGVSKPGCMFFGMIFSPKVCFRKYGQPDVRDFRIEVAKKRSTADGKEHHRRREYGRRKEHGPRKEHSRRVISRGLSFQLRHGALPTSETGCAIPRNWDLS